MQKATHHEAVAALIKNTPEIRLLVRHDPPPPGIQVSYLMAAIYLGPFLVHVKNL